MTSFGALLIRRSSSLAALVLVLAIAFAVSAYTFGVLDTTYLRPLPFDPNDHLVLIHSAEPGRGIPRRQTWYRDYMDWRTAQKTLSEHAAYYTGTVVVSGLRGTDRLNGAYLAGNTFDMLGVRPLLGRPLTRLDGDASMQPVAVISQEVWRDLFGSDPQIVGRAVRVNGTPTVVVGVMPQDFRFPFAQSVWLPLRWREAELDYIGGHQVWVLGKLAPEASVADAQREFSALARRLEIAKPHTHKGVEAVVVPYRHLMQISAAVPLKILAAAACLLVLVCLSNCLNILLLMVYQKSAELALYQSFGATDRQLTNRIALEVAAIILVAAPIGVLLASVALEATDAALPEHFPAPFWWDFSLSGSVALGLGAVIVGCWAALYTAAARHAAGLDICAELRQQGRGQLGTSSGRAVVATILFQMTIAACVVLLAAQVFRAAIDQWRLDFGADTAQVLTGRVALMTDQYADPAEKQAALSRALAAVQEIVGVEYAAYTETLPGALLVDYWNFAVEGRRNAPAEPQRVIAAGISRDYFRVFRIPLLAGHTFGPHAGAQDELTAIVSASFAKSQFGAETPIGRTLRLGVSADEMRRARIVGVAGDVLYTDGIEGSEDAVYLPAPHVDERFWSVALRVRGRAEDYGGALRDAVFRAAPDVPVYFLQSADEIIEERASLTNLGAFVGGVTALGTMLFAIIGCYALLGRHLYARRNELGVHLALGATGREATWVLLRQALLASTLGTAAGTLLYLLVVRFLTSPGGAWGTFDLASFLAGLVLLSLIGPAVCALALHANMARYSPAELLRS